MTVVITGVESAHPTAATCALAELGGALHVLNEPVHHDATEWAEQVRAALSAQTRDAVPRWAWLTQAIRASPFVGVGPLAGDLAGELDELCTADAHDLARGLLRPISPKGDSKVARRWARSRGPEVAAQVDALIDEPAVAVADFARFVESCCDDWFASEWQRVRPQLGTHARKFADLAARTGVVGALAALDPSITASSRDAVTIAKVQSRRYNVAERGLVCLPSAFIRPHLYLADVPERPLILIYPIDEVRDDTAPAVNELTDRLDAMTSPGRLEVARAIATEPRTAGEIADLWSMDVTLVTKHLRTLASAGLATTTRRGRFVQYALDRDAVARLGDELLGLLLR